MNGMRGLKTFYHRKTAATVNQCREMSLLSATLRAVLPQLYMRIHETKNKSYASRMGKKYSCFLCKEKHYKSLLTEKNINGRWELVCAKCFIIEM